MLLLEPEIAEPEVMSPPPAQARWSRDEEEVGEFILRHVLEQDEIEHEG
jgi:hypothetical protein